MPETIDLHPCPFCGSGDVTLSNGYDEDGNWVVLCGECKSSGTFCVEKAKAVNAWNTRADLPRAIVDTNDAELWRYFTAIAVAKGFESINDALAKVAPRAKGETTVEAALGPHKAINFLTALEHQVHRNHEYRPGYCAECTMTETIANKLREQLRLNVRAAAQTEAESGEG